MSVNKAIILGRLGKSPELKYLPNGNAVCNITVATSESWKDKTTGQKQEKTEWHNIVFYGKQAEIVNQYMDKGSNIYIEGKIATRSWEKDGVKRYSTEVVAGSFQFIDSKKESSKPEQQGFSNDDIPF